MAPPLPAPSPRPGAPLPTPSPRPGAPPMTPQPPPTATPFRTPTSKHRLHFPPATPRSNPHHATATEHPVEVIGRVRNLTSTATGPSALEVPASTTTIRVRGDAGGGSSYRDFSLDGVSVSDDEDLESFYRRFVRSRIEGVRVGAKCTVMVYGPTGSGKSHTMFGCAKQPGIVYRALRDILDGGGGCGEGGEEEDAAGFGVGLFVQVAVLEIYNEEIYDLLVGSGASTKGNTPKVRLEVMGKKAKNATYISGNEAGKISREVAKVEKRRTVKSTLCNERSSRSHCMIILDVPSVGGRLMLVDMAGSENIEAAGQTGFEAKMQTAKINQGNTALKRVVESIANGDSHVPFRDSKLTMLLQDSFEDDKSKILMILCASPDPKELHKTVSTLEYGAKAKCIIRAAHASTPRDKMNTEESSSMLNSRIEAMNQFIYKLQKENKQREKERNEVQTVLRHKEEELAQVRAKLRLMEGQGAAAKEEEINTKVNEKTKSLKIELQVMEEKMLRQQQELLALKQRLQEAEREKVDTRQPIQQDIVGGRLFARLSEMAAGGDPSMSMAMSMSMDLDAGDQPSVLDVKVIKEDTRQQGQIWNSSTTAGSCTSALEQEDVVRLSGFPEKAVLSTVYEEGDEGEEKDSSAEQEEVCKEVVEEESYKVDRMEQPLAEPDRTNRIQNIFRLCGNYRELVKKQNAESPVKQQVLGDDENKQLVQQLLGDENSLQAKQLFGDESKDPSAAWAAIETPMCDVKVADSPVSSQLSPIFCQVVDEAGLTVPEELKSCTTPEANDQSKQKEREGLLEVYIKWESGNLIKRLKLLPTACLSDLRKLVEAHFEEASNKKQQQQHQYTFLLLGDPSGAPVSREKESTVQISKLPNWNNQTNSYLACLRAVKKPAADQLHQMPFSPLESKLNSALNDVQQQHRASGALSPKVVGQMSPSFIRELRA